MMSNTQNINKSIESPQENHEATMDGLVADLRAMKGRVEINNEIAQLKNSAEFIKQAELGQFFADVECMQSVKNAPIDQVDPSTYESFEFLVGRLVVLPVLVNAMIGAKSASSGLINIGSFEQARNALPLSTARGVIQSIRTIGGTESQEAEKICGLLTDDSPLFSSRRDQRLMEHVVDPLISASTVYAEQYNTIMQQEQSNEQQTGLLGQVKDDISSGNFSIDRIGEIRSNAEPTDKRKMIGLGVGALLGGAFLLFKKREKRPTTGNKIWGAGGDIAQSLGVGLGGGFLGILIMKAIEGKQLTFEQSLEVATTEIKSHISENEMSAGFSAITYDENNGSINSYRNKSTLINKNAKKLPGFDIKFQSYKSLIHAANFVNYVQHMYAYRGVKNEPFTTKGNTGDIYIEMSHGDKEVMSGGWFSTLSKLCPEINKDINTRIMFCNYLNKLNCRKQKDQDENFEDDKSDMGKAMFEVIKTIRETDPETREGGVRELGYELINETSNQSTIRVLSYGFTSLIKVEKDQQGNYKKINFGDNNTYYLSSTSSNLGYRHNNNHSLLCEGIYTANLSHWIMKHYHNQGIGNEPFSIVNARGSMTGKRTIGIKKSLGGYVYHYQQVLKNISDNHKKYPTLFKEIHKSEYFSKPQNSGFIKYLNELYNNIQI